MNRINIANISDQKDLITEVGRLTSVVPLPDVTKISKWKEFSDFMDSIGPNSRVACYGDYDVDGLMALLITLDAIKTIGAKARPYGYKHRTHFLDSMFASFVSTSNVTHCIICDTGSSEGDVRLEQYIENLGVKVLVIDHHLSFYGYAEAPVSLVNCVYEGPDFSCTCAAAFTWLLFNEYVQKRGYSLPPLDVVYAYIATVADVMDLSQDTNVAIRQLAQDVPRKTWSIVLQKLSEMAAKGGISTRTVGFIIAPTINACFRSGALDLINIAFVFDRPDDQKLKAVTEMNNLRNENSAMLSVIDNLAKPEVLNNLVLLDLSSAEEFFSITDVDYTNYTGLIANKLLSRFNKPAIVYGVGTKFGKGSVRAPERSMLFEPMSLIAQCGGHPDAFGFHFPATGKQFLEYNLRKLDLIAGHMSEHNKLELAVLNIPLTYDGFYQIAWYNEFRNNDSDKLYADVLLNKITSVKIFDDKVYHYEGKLRFIGSKDHSFERVRVMPAISNGNVNCYIIENEEEKHD